MDTFQNKLDLMRLIIDLRAAQPMGVVGLLEARNLLANLFPEFEEVRDEELDQIINNYARSLQEEDAYLTGEEADDDEDVDPMNFDNYMTQEELE